MVAQRGQKHFLQLPTWLWSAKQFRTPPGFNRQAEIWAAG